MPPEDQNTLSDWLCRQRHVSPIVAAEGWQSLIWPEWCDGQIVWRLSTSAEAVVTRCEAQHGFDELSSYLVQGARMRKPAVLMQQDPETYMSAYLRLNALD